MVKNKVAPPFRDAETEIIYGHGVCMAGELLDFATENELISKSGSWYTLGQYKIGQGREKAREWLGTQSDLQAALRASATSSDLSISVESLEKLIEIPKEPAKAAVAA